MSAPLGPQQPWSHELSPQRSSQPETPRRVLPSETQPSARGFVEFLGGAPGRHALIGSSAIEISSHTAAWWATPARIILGVASLFLALGWLQKAPCLRTAEFNGSPHVDWSGTPQYTSACYTDALSLYGSHGLEQLKFPYVHSWVDGADQIRYMEYPVLSGLYQWIIAAVAVPVQWLWKTLPLPAAAPEAIYFGVNAIALSIAWMAAVVVVIRLAGPRVWDALLMAASPLVIVHVYTNFDALPCLAAVVALALWRAGKPGWAGVAVGIGVALKLWPAFIGGAMILVALKQRRWADVGWVMASTLTTWLFVNVPFFVQSPRGWAEFFRLNSQRGWEGSTLYAVVAHIVGDNRFDGSDPFHAVEGVGALNMIVAILLASGIAALAWFVLGSLAAAPRVEEVAFLATFIFMVTNKVWSPQYSLWLLPLVVLALPRWRLVWLWASIEAVYWYVRMWQFLPANLAAPNWLADTLTVVRIVILCVMAWLVIRNMRRRTIPAPVAPPVPVRALLQR